MHDHPTLELDLDKNTKIGYQDICSLSKQKGQNWKDKYKNNATTV